MLLLLLIIVPLLAALLSRVSRKSGPIEWIAGFAALMELAAGTAIALNVAGAGQYNLGNGLVVDPFGAIVMLIVVVVGCAVALYSIGYLRGETEKEIIGFRRVRQYFVLMHLFVAAMFVATAAANPIVMWIAIEATTLSAVFLISFYNKPTSMEAAWKFLIINSIGLLLGFLGMLMFLALAGGEASQAFPTWATLLAHASALNPLVAKIAFAFVLVGYGTKVGLAPMHTWKPDAYSKAPAPIGALFSGPLLAIAFLALLRFRAIADIAAGPDFSRNLLIIFGVISLLIAAFIIFGQKNYKRLLAYSSIEHAGIMALGFGFGGIGIFAAILHMIYHALAKAILFFSSGNVMLKFGSSKILKSRGVLAALPVTGVLLIIGFLAITGVPPFGLFITEFYILSAGIAAHPIVVGLALTCLALIFAGFLRHIVRMVFEKEEQSVKTGESNFWTLFPPVVMVCILIILGFYLPGTLKTLLDSAALIK